MTFQCFFGLLFYFGTQSRPICPVDGDEINPLIGGPYMDSLLKERISHLRNAGQSYAQIAKTLDVSINSVKSYCRRNKLGNDDFDLEKPKECSQCLFCGKSLMHISGKKKKSFCSDVCRMAWWKDNRNTIKQAAWYETKCGFCRKTFHSYGNRHRKYCSHSCYIQARFGRTSS